MQSKVKGARIKLQNINAKISDYLFIHRWHFVFLLGIFVLLDFISRAPYFSILLTFSYKTIVLWLIAVAILKLPSRSNFLAAFIFIILSIIEVLRNRIVKAEMVGITVYYLLAIGFLQSFWSYLKQIRGKSEKK